MGICASAVVTNATLAISTASVAISRFNTFDMEVSFSHSMDDAISNFLGRTRRSSYHEVRSGPSRAGKGNGNASARSQQTRPKGAAAARTPCVFSCGACDYTRRVVTGGDVDSVGGGRRMMESEPRG